MAKVTVNFDMKNTQIITETIAKQMGARTVKIAKDMISKGISPVKGVGRFDGYAATRKTSQLRKVKKTFKSKKARSAARALLKEREQSEYPWTVRDKYPDKKVRPVNLSLNGWYLSHYTWWIHKKNILKRAFQSRSSKKAENKVVSIGLSSTTGQFSKPPKKVMDYFKTHNNGTQAPNVPQRKHLPTGLNDEFASSIMRELKRIIERRVKNMIIAENNKTRNNKRTR
jgi:hypothetical protein